MSSAAELPRRQFLMTGATFLFLSGCGFTPLVRGETSESDQKPRLAKLTVTSPEPRFDYHLRRRMLQFIEIDSRASQSLTVETEIRRIDLAITDSDDITRFTFQTASRYRLDEGTDAISRGVSSSATSVNTTASQFATEISERDALRRIAEETAEKLVNILRLAQ